MKKKQKRIQIILLSIGFLLILITYFYYPYMQKTKFKKNLNVETLSPDQSDEDFNTGYHEDVLRKDLSELGWDAKALNEAEAICYSELEDNEYT